MEGRCGKRKEAASEAFSADFEDLDLSKI